MTSDLGPQKIMKYYKNLKFGWTHNLKLVSLEEIRLWQQQLKNTQKQIPNFSFPVQLYQISPFCFKQFVWDCLSKQIFGPKLAQPPFNSNFLAFSITPKYFSDLQQKYKASSCVKVPNLMVFCKHYFAYLIQVKKFTLKSFQLCLVLVF